MAATTTDVDTLPESPHSNGKPFPPTPSQEKVCNRVDSVDFVANLLDGSLSSLPMLSSLPSLSDWNSLSKLNQEFSMTKSPFWKPSTSLTRWDSIFLEALTTGQPQCTPTRNTPRQNTEGITAHSSSFQEDQNLKETGWGCDQLDSFNKGTRIRADSCRKPLKKRKVVIETAPNSRRHQRTKPKDINYVDEINDKDVLCGRGTRTNLHPGNKIYLQIADARRQRYKSTGNMNVKKALIMEILDIYKSENARFLEYDSDVNRWYVLPESMAYKKVSQRLRDNPSTPRRVLTGKGHSKTK